MQRLNPKAAMFFVALMPQFLAHGAEIAYVMALSVIALTITTAWFQAVSTLARSDRPAVRAGLGQTHAVW